MSRRSVALAILLSASVTACRRSHERLADVPRIAYGSKPAVVRVNAYATAQFRYPTSAISAVAEAIGAETRNLNGKEATVDTGAGGSGSGFMVRSDGCILTSGHVIAPTRDAAKLEQDLRRNGAIAALVRHIPIEFLRAQQRVDSLDRYIDLVARLGSIEKMRVVNDVELSDGESSKFRVAAYSPALNERGTDLALLRIARENLPSLPLGDSDMVRVGDSIWTIGYPAVASSTDETIGGWLSRDSDLEATFNLGTITAIKRDVANREVLQSNVAIYRGNSGGPAVDEQGRVIGIASWGHSEADQIKFLVPVNVAKAFLQEAKVTPSTGGEFNRSYSAALEAAGKGEWREAQNELDSAARFFRNSPDVARFRSDVERAIRDTPWWQLHFTAAALLALVLIGAVAVGVLVMLRDRARIPALLTSSAPVETVMPSARDGAVAALPRTLGRFTILNGARAGERLGLGGTGIRIGRERAICEIVLENPKVSRIHAEVVSMDGRVLLIDRNSSNGTYVNDQKIEKRFLKNGDIIYFGGRNAVAVAFHA